MKLRKQKAKLERRLADYVRLTADRHHDAKVQLRIDSGGYKRPGSMKK